MNKYKFELDRVEIMLIIGVLALAFTLAITACNSKPGKDGRPGIDAHSPVVTTRSANAQECPLGGVTIQVDSQAPVAVCDGSNGLSGQNGAPGITGTQISLVQFCPGTTMYPTTFIEIGICIQDNLYAVYSDHGGFMTLIPPGTYTSNGIGSSCNFTVLAHCGVL